MKLAWGGEETFILGFLLLYLLEFEEFSNLRNYIFIIIHLFPYIYMYIPSQGRLEGFRFNSYYTEV